MHQITNYILKFLPEHLLTKDYLGSQVHLVILDKGYNLSSHLHNISFQVAISKISITTGFNLLNIIKLNSLVQISSVSPHKGCARIGDPEPDQRLISHIKGYTLHIRAKDPVVFFQIMCFTGWQEIEMQGCLPNLGPSCPPRAQIDDHCPNLSQQSRPGWNETSYRLLQINVAWSNFLCEPGEGQNCDCDQDEEKAKLFVRLHCPR